MNHLIVALSETIDEKSILTALLKDFNYKTSSGPIFGVLSIWKILVNTGAVE